MINEEDGDFQGSTETSSDVGLNVLPLGLSFGNLTIVSKKRKKKKKLRKAFYK